MWADCLGTSVFIYFLLVSLATVPWVTGSRVLNAPRSSSPCPTLGQAPRRSAGPAATRRAQLLERGAGGGGPGWRSGVPPARRAFPSKMQLAGHGDAPRCQPELEGSCLMS